MLYMDLQNGRMSQGLVPHSGIDFDCVLEVLGVLHTRWNQSRVLRLFVP